MGTKYARIFFLPAEAHADGERQSAEEFFAEVTAGTLREQGWHPQPGHAADWTMLDASMVEYMLSRHDPDFAFVTGDWQLRVIVTVEEDVPAEVRMGDGVAPRG
jgi:hypothetical protein